MDSLSEYNPDLIILAGFMKILQDPFLKKFHNSIINIHPSLLPSFKGLRSIERAFDMGVRITGCTIHWVNSDLDGGKIIAQAPVRIMEGDSLEIVTARVHAAEHMLLPWVVSDLSQGIIPFPK
jgi:phosphoribosylglycinamide formyltransferase-1